MRYITNKNTLKALIRDERMASAEYAHMANQPDVPPRMRAILAGMSHDEARHRSYLEAYMRSLG